MVDPSDNSIPVHGVVPSTLVGLLYDYLENRGIDAATLLNERRPDTGRHDLARYPARRWQQLLQAAARHLDDPLLGLKLGQTVTAAHFGVIGYVLHNCADLGAAFERFRRFERLVYDMEPADIRLAPDALVLEWGVGHGRPGPLVDETAVTALVAFARTLTGQTVRPQSIGFVNPEPAQRAPYTDYFGCPVLFEQPRTWVRVPLHALALPLRAADPALLSLLENQAEAQLAGLPAADEIQQAVRSAIARLLPEADPGLDAVAAQLNTSSRTLHRRLAQRQVNFRQLLDATRLELAEQHLTDPRLTLADVALLLGYSEQSAFTRAFKGWTGQTPAAWRRAYRNVSGPHRA